MDLCFYPYTCLQVKVLITQSCPTLPMDCSPPDSSVHGILQARILEWVAIAFSMESSQPRDRTWVSHIGRRLLYHLSHQGSPYSCLSLRANPVASIRGPDNRTLHPSPVYRSQCKSERSPTHHPLRKLQGVCMLDLMVPRGLTATYFFKRFFGYFPAIFFSRDRSPCAFVSNTVLLNFSLKSGSLFSSSSCL